MTWFTVPTPGWGMKTYLDHLCKLNLGNGTWPGGHFSHPRDRDNRAVRPIHISVPKDGGTTEDREPRIDFLVYPVVGYALVGQHIRFPLRDELRDVEDEEPLLFEGKGLLRKESRDRIQDLLGED